MPYENFSLRTMCADAPFTATIDCHSDFQDDKESELQYNIEDEHKKQGKQL